jgi:hypothetical protein
VGHIEEQGGDGGGVAWRKVRVEGWVYIIKRLLINRGTQGWNNWREEWKWGIQFAEMEE